MIQICHYNQKKNVQSKESTCIHNVYLFNLMSVYDCWWSHEKKNILFIFLVDDWMRWCAGCVTLNNTMYNSFQVLYLRSGQNFDFKMLFWSCDTYRDNLCPLKVLLTFFDKDIYEFKF